MRCNVRISRKGNDIPVKKMTKLSNCDGRSVSIAHYILILLILVTLGSLRYLISDPTCLVHVIGFPALSEKFDMTT